MADVAAARVRARTLWPDADRLLFTGAALEQASHPIVASWRARRYAGAEVVVDLCAGAGSDSLALAAAGDGVVAIDVDPLRTVLARHNATVRELPVLPVVGDALRPPVGDGHLVHVDPARRAGGRRARRLDDYVPAVSRLVTSLTRARGLGVVVSPGVALDDPALPRGELEFVQVGDDLVEAVVWLGELRTPGVEATATLLPAGHRLRRGGRPAALDVGPVGAWLLEVAPAAVRGRLHDRLGAEIGARRIATTRALLTTDDQPAASPWWRVWEVEAVLPPRPREVRHWLQAHDPDQPIEISTHGLDADPQRWWHRLGRPPRGPRARRLHLVRSDEGAFVVVCRPPAGS